MRKEDWPSRLAAYLQSRQKTPFKWGSNDCVSFAAGAVEAMTGTNPMPSLKYRSAKTAAAAVDKRGGLKKAVDGALKGARVRVAFARRGDVVMADIEGRDTVTVCIGHALIGPGADGLVTVPLTRGCCAWRV